MSPVVKREEPRGGLFAALAKAQAQLNAPGKNREVTVKLREGGGSYKFKYATLDHLIEHVRKPLTDNGLWFVQMTEPGAMITRIIHESGESLDSAVPMPNLPTKPQEAGSVLTFFRRYSLSVALGLAADEDDDANVAEGNGYEARQPNDRAARGRNNGPTKAQLDAAENRIAHELNGCGDEDSLTAYTSTDEYKADKALLEEFRSSALYGPPPRDCPEYLPIKERIKRMVAEFRASSPSDGPHIFQAG